MTAEQYKKISAPFRTAGRIKALKFINIFITAAGYGAYPAMVMYIFITSPDMLPAVIAVPAVGFLSLTFIRKKINRPRPYEALDIEPIISKDTRGKSMPSRHVFSMTIIAVTGFIVSPAVGGVLMVFSFCLAFIRVIGGVHYPSDVIIGALSAVIWGSFWYMIIL